MNTNTILQFNKILETLADFALSQKAKEQLLSLKPLLNERECKAKMQETTASRQVLDSVGSPPIS